VAIASQRKGFTREFRVFDQGMYYTFGSRQMTKKRRYYLISKAEKKPAKDNR
jgi:hypothetical protein